MNLSFDYATPYITEASLSILLGGSDDRRYSWVKRALKRGFLVRLKRGFYLIQQKGTAPLIDNFELAGQLYSPSYISFESALSYHGWIPEAVYITTSACTKRGQIINTPVGTFRYEQTPLEQFYMGVERIVAENSIFFVASPWKALLDYLYKRHKNWRTLNECIEDLRLDQTMIRASDLNVLKEISTYYDSPRVRKFARACLAEF